MAVYSYTKKIVTGPFGTTYDFTPADTKYTALGTVEDKSYVLIEDVSALPEQSAEINFTEDSLPEDLLNKYKKLKRDRISETSHQFDGEILNQNMKVNSSLGFIANADIRSQNNLRALIDITSDNETVTYMDYDSIPRKITLSDLKLLLKEIIINGSYLYQQKWDKCKAIDSATSYDELAAVSDTFEMKDFTI